MNILVTGSNGQLGTHLRLLEGGGENQYFFTDVEELDICRRDAVFNYVLTNGINVVINCAAYTNVDGAEDAEETAELVNATAVRHLADAMKVSGGVLIHFSTDYVFGGAGYNRPIREDDATNPTSVYGLSKLHGEEAIAEVGCHAIVIRTAWLYSEYGRNFVKTMMRLTEEKPSLNVVFDQVGTPTYAGDLARLVFDMVEHRDLRNLEGVYNYTNEGVCSWYDFAFEIARLTGRKECRIEPCHSNEFPSKVVRPPYSVLDKSKVKKVLGIDIPHWSESLEVCLRGMVV